MYHRILKGLYHLSVYVVGVVVLIAAITVTMIRLLLPDIGAYKDQVEAGVSRYMGSPVLIDSIQADWRGWVPHLHLAGITLLNKNGTRKIIHFARSQIDIDPVKTLLERQIIPRELVISGFEVAVTRLANGAIYIAGVNITDTDKDAHDKNELAEWLFKQDNIEIEDARIEWLDVKHQQETIPLAEVALTLRTHDRRLQVDGSARLPQQYGDKIRFAFDASGDLTSSNWSGELYLSASDVVADNWYRHYRPAEIRVAGGSADLEIWSSWAASKPALIEGAVKYKDFTVTSGNQGLHVEELSFQFKGMRLEDNHWHLSLKPDTVLTENGYWREGSFELAALKKDDSGRYRYAFYFDHLRLADLTALISHLDIIPEGVRGAMLTGAIDGELEQGLILYDPGAKKDKRFIYDVTFRDLKVDLTEDRPVINTLSGRLRGATRAGALGLAGAPGSFNLPSVPEKPLSLSAINGDIYWSLSPEGWRLQIGQLLMQTQDFSFEIKGGLEKDESHALPHLSLIAKVKSDRLENLSDYLPDTPGFRIKNWMERSLQAGEVTTAIGVIRGYADDFPFRNNEGQFKGLINVSHAILAYSQKWPPVEDIEAEVLFDNEKMLARFQQGQIYGARITRGAAVIPDLTKRPKIISLDGKIKGGVTDLSRFISQSPLSKDNILNHINQTLVSGDMGLDLNMELPIKAPGLKPAISGTLDLREARLDSKRNKLILDSIHGEVHFTRTSAHAEGLSSWLDGEQVALSISGAKDDGENPPTFQITGHSSDRFISHQIAKRYPALGHFSTRLAEHISGSTDWRAKIVFNSQGEGLTQRLELSSDLYGMAIELPEPMRKPADGRKHLQLSKTLFANTPTRLSYGSLVKANIYVDKNNKQQPGALEVFMGDPLAQQSGHSGEGVMISGETDKLPLGQWLKTIAAFTQGKKKQGGLFSDTPMHMDIKTDRLSIFEQSFRGAHFIANRNPENWQIEVTGEDLSGEIRIARGASRNGTVELDLKKLVLGGQHHHAGSAGKADPTLLPNIHVRVAELIYDGKKLGDMQLLARPTKTGLSIDRLQFSKPGLNIKGTGIWNRANDMDSSHLTMTLHAETLDMMLETFGHEVASMRDGETNITLDARWDGAPWDASLDRLNGSLDIHIKKGRILEVNPSISRLFGLLSLQTLPRRLSLDFTDLLGKGLAFDHIRGSFNMTNGNAYTNNLHLTGPGANVSVSGRVGLAARDYDQIITVTPQLADNLPVASALLGPVGIGVGAVLYLTSNMFKSMNNNIDGLLRYQYTITGSWDAPKIEKINARRADDRISAHHTGIGP